jgi:2,5-dioxopentanoate dehydrogenase
VRRPEPIPFYAEMGSTNPVFFLPGALAERPQELAAAFAGSITLGVGQFCTNPGLFVVDQHQTAFTNAVAQHLNTQSAGTMLTNGIAEAYRRGIEQQRAVAGTLPATEWPAEGSKPHLLLTDVSTALNHPELTEEVFGPSSVGIVASSKAELLQFAHNLHGHLTATLHGTEADFADYADLIDILTTKVGRLVFNGFPTGLDVCAAMVHGGPFPATTDSRSTSVGSEAVYRFTRPICFQAMPTF